MTKSQRSFVDEVKGLIADPHKHILLHDTAIQKADVLLVAVSSEAVPGDAEINLESVTSRFKRYELLSEDLQTVFTLTAYWGNQEHHPTLENALTRLTETRPTNRSNDFWQRLQWYPVAWIMYASGIAAVAADRYANLAAMLSAWSGYDELGNDIIALSRLRQAISNLNEPIKNLPEYKGNYTAASNYLFNNLLPDLEKKFAVGQRYEVYFDRFELLAALLHKDLTKSQGTYIGRFAWKYKRQDFNSQSPRNLFTMINAEAERPGGYLEAGLFGGSSQRFKGCLDALKQEVESLNWY